MQTAIKQAQANIALEISTVNNYVSTINQNVSAATYPTASAMSTGSCSSYTQNAFSDTTHVSTCAVHRYPKDFGRSYGVDSFARLRPSGQYLGLDRPHDLATRRRPCNCS